jgi:DNA (cytosine-5)-methyltransferase 1
MEWVPSETEVLDTGSGRENDPTRRLAGWGLRNDRYWHGASRVASGAAVTTDCAFDGCLEKLVRLPSLGEVKDDVGWVSYGGGVAKFGFTFIDLFAGIGGTRTAFEQAGGRCVFTSEWDRFAQKTYSANFPGEPIIGDIRAVVADDVPMHDVLVAGFPCQPFSLAGVSKKNSLGRAHGFACDTQGTLFFDVARILEAKRPQAFLLENVKNLLSHDGGKTFAIIKRTLQEELGYYVESQVISSAPYVPQKRERVFIVGMTQPFSLEWPLWPSVGGPTMRDVLHPQDGSESSEPPYTFGSRGLVDSRYVLSDHLWTYLQNYAQKHRAKGNGFGFGLVGPNDVARTLSARYHKDGSEILVKRGRYNPRRLTPREAARLMGFPDSWKIPVSDTQAYRQFGNSVVVPLVAEVASLLADLLAADQIYGRTA